MTTLADAVANCREILQDTDNTGYVWPTGVFELFLGEATRRLSPMVYKRAAVAVSPNGSDVSFVLDTLASAVVVDVEGVVADFMLPSWEVWGGNLNFEYAPDSAFLIRCQVEYSSITELPLKLVDPVVYYACGRALGWLVKRGGAALRRYLVDQGDLDAKDVESLGSSYMADFFAWREEQSTSTARSL